MKIWIIVLTKKEKEMFKEIFMDQWYDMYKKS